MAIALCLDCRVGPLGGACSAPTVFMVKHKLVLSVKARMISTLILASSPTIKVVASPTHPVSSKWIALSILTIYDVLSKISIF